MNRRTTLKSILALSAAGISSFSAYKWISLNKEVNVNELLSYQSLIAELAETITNNSIGNNFLIKVKFLFMVRILRTICLVTIYYDL